MIVQQYIQNPYLIGKKLIKDGLKFDCRLYVLVKNINPLKIFLFKDGIARLATE
jgi:tubulin polyglutamylase TTLL6/13